MHIPPKNRSHGHAQVIFALNALYYWKQPVCRRCAKITGVVTMGSVSGQSLHPDVGQVSEHDLDTAGVALSGHLRF